MKQLVYTYKKLNFLYTVHDTYTCGIMLEGWEASSLKNHNGDINTAFCSFNGNDFCLINSKITPMRNHELQNKSVTEKQTRNRYLLLNKKELKKIKESLSIKGYTCVPSKLYQNERGLWKVNIAIVSGKKTYDKRESIKQRDLDRDQKRES